VITVRDSFLHSKLKKIGYQPEFPKPRWFQEVPDFQQGSFQSKHMS